ncbi:MAG: hypothetical protein ACYTFI_21935, partial [Planctomycetota bacterium]
MAENKRGTMYCAVLIAVLVPLAGCRRKHSDASNVSVSKAHLWALTEALAAYYDAHGQYPDDLGKVRIADSGSLVDPFTGSSFLYATSQDAEGNRFACLVAGAGRDGAYQLNVSSFAGPQVGRFPRNWSLPVATYRSLDGYVQDPTRGGDICVQLVNNTHCVNEIDIRVGDMATSEWQKGMENS